METEFQLTPSRRATCIAFGKSVYILISTHALTEGDAFRNSEKLQAQFQLTPSRRATLLPAPVRHIPSFQLTPSRRATAFPQFSVSDRRNFNSRPHGGRPERGNRYGYAIQISTHALTEGDLRQNQLRRRKSISTHALTEGDGKFRQIFLLNRGYAYSISLYFLPHFISLLPQILSFQQKSFKFQVRIFLLFSVHLAFALQNQCVHHVKYRFCTNMFYFVFVLFTQIVKPQTIGLFIYDFF